MKIRIFIILAALATSATAYASTQPVAEVSGGVRAGLITVAFAIAFLSVAIKSSVQGEEIPVQSVLFRLLFVVLGLMAASKIQGFLWGIGQSVGDSLVPGMSIGDLHATLLERVAKTHQEKFAIDGLGSIMKDPMILVNLVAYWILLLIEECALTIFFVAFKWFQAMHAVVMQFLGAIGPFMITASIIPGISGFTHWVKLVISVALWPAIASFFFKSHLITTLNFFGDMNVITSNVQDFFINMDSLNLLAESILSGCFLLATPFLASAVVNGSANAFATGSAFLLGAGHGSIAHKMYRMSRGESLGGKPGGENKSRGYLPGIFLGNPSNGSKSAQYRNSSASKVSEYENVGA